MKNVKLYAPFLYMGLTCLKATDPLPGDSSFFTTGIIGKTYLKCKYPVFIINIAQTLHYKVAIK